MSELGVCYVADTNFLYPTLLSITSLREFVPAEELDVFVVVFSDPSLDFAAIRDGTRHLGITFIEVDRDGIPGFEGVDWQQTHVSPAAAGRFLLPALLPKRTQRILYIDGDTLFVGDPARLLAFHPPPGKLAVVADAIDFFRQDNSPNGRTTRAYCTSLGIPDTESYFNSGVILVDRESWAGIAAEALTFFADHSALCTFHDQSALNAIIKGRKVALSPVWNYQSRFRYWGDPPGLVPHLLHFAGAEKPWTGDVEPWRDIRPGLLAFAETLAHLDLPRGHLSEARIATHNRQFHDLKHRIRALVDYRRMRKRWALQRLHETAAA